jgi:hypothetical protein
MTMAAYAGFYLKIIEPGEDIRKRAVGISDKGEAKISQQDKKGVSP